MNKVYDEEANATVNLSTDKVSVDDVTPAYTSASFPNKDVGTGKSVSVFGISISGSDAFNYNLTNTTASTTADITSRPITVSAVADTKVYDSTMSSDETPQVTLGSIASGDTANFSQAYDTKDVGTGKTLTPSGSVTTTATAATTTTSASSKTTTASSRRRNSLSASRPTTRSTTGTPTRRSSRARLRT